jgi:DNA primase
MAGLLSPTTLEQVRAASDIVDVIGAALPLKRAGANFVTLCPFHREKTPSFNVNPHRQIFHCFGCHKGGDVFTFIQQYENITFIEAVRRLAERANIALEFETSPGQERARYVKETLLQIHEQITRRWHSALLNEAGGQIARDYLHQRGVSDDAVKLFRLGYAPDLWDDTVNWARSKDYELATVEQAGLILRKEDRDHYYDRFRGRLIFPICDEQGRVIGFSGRILSGDEKTAKYVNSPETPIFSKGKVFFGLDKSKRAILDADCAIICEGQLDLIACYMAGVQNVVAPQGTAFTPEHARILKRYVDEVVLCFDSDPAGQTAAVRVLDSLLASGLAIRVMTMPAPHDPDSFIKEHGGAAFQQLVARAEGFFDFYLGHLCVTNDLTTDKGRVTIVKAMAEAVLKTRSAVLADTYAQKTAQRLGVSPESVRLEFRKTPRAKTIDPDPTLAPQSDAENQPPPPEREFWLLKFLLLDDQCVEWAANHLNLEWLAHPTVRQIIAARLEAHAQHDWHGIPGLLARCEEEAMRSLITQAVAENHSLENLSRKITETVQLLRNDFIDGELAKLTRQLAQPDLSETALIAIEKQKSELRQLKKQSLSSPNAP